MILAGSHAVYKAIFLASDMFGKTHRHNRPCYFFFFLTVTYVSEHGLLVLSPTWAGWKWDSVGGCKELRGYADVSDY